MTTKTEAKSAYSTLHDLKNDLARTLRQVRIQTLSWSQETLLKAYEDGRVTTDEQAKAYVQDFILTAIGRFGDTYSSSQGRVQCYEQTIKDALNEVWQDVRYETDLRKWAADKNKARWWA